MQKYVPILVLFALAGCATAAGPQLDPAAEAGRRIAIRSCSGCHSTTSGAASLYRAAPPFWTLAGHTPGSLQKAAATGDVHRFAMPSIVLTPEESRELLAYVRALAAADPATRRALGAPPCIATARC